MNPLPAPWRRAVRMIAMLVLISTAMLAVAPAAHARDLITRIAFVDSSDSGNLVKRLFEGSCGSAKWDVKIVYSFGRVERDQAYVKWIKVKYRPLNRYGMTGGWMSIWNSKYERKLPTADYYDFYDYEDGHWSGSYTLDVYRWFVGGGPDGRFALVTEKAVNMDTARLGGDFGDCWTDLQMAVQSR